jgi:hypothetical protein
VIGGMAGMVTQSWFGNDMVANDLALFIHPDHRGGLMVAVQPPHRQKSAQPTHRLIRLPP